MGMEDLADLCILQTRLHWMQRVIDAAVCETKAEQALDYQASQRRKDNECKWIG